jgi:hypothetical protein
MGFEVIFTCVNKKEDGAYDLENPTTFKRTIGSPHDETPLEELAKVVLKQLARRDKLITDVEPYEFIKKKISFSESKGGILLKHKKYTLDQGELIGQDVPQLPAPVQQTTPTPVQQTTPAPSPASNNLKAIRTEIFDPQYPGLAQETKKRGFKFTLGKKYPIYEERPAPGGTYAGMNYKTADDNGDIQVLNSLHFRPPAVLTNDFTEEDGLAKKRSDDNFNEPVQDIRAIARSRGMISG